MELCDTGVESKLMGCHPLFPTSGTHKVTYSVIIGSRRTCTANIKSWHLATILFDVIIGLGVRLFRAESFPPACATGGRFV